MNTLYLLINSLMFLCANVMVAAPLASAKITEPFAWELTSPQGFMVRDAQHDKQKKCAADHLKIEYRNGSFVLNDLPTLTQKLELSPLFGTFSFGGIAAVGDMQLSCVDGVCSLTQAIQLEQPTSLDKKLFNVRVLLDTWDLKAASSDASHTSWHLKSAHGIAMRSAGNLGRQEAITIQVHRGNLMINGKKIDKNRVELAADDGVISFGNHEYRGAFLIVKRDTTVYLMNSLDIEEYVFSVLRTESWPGWPLEINKVFAIACRTYAIAMIMRSKNSKLPYHIKNTNAHQTYTGHHENPVIRQAVDETKNIFLGFEGKPIIAMFDGCCGGVIPAKIKGFNFTGAPYLARPYACTFCKSCKLYSWHAHYGVEQLLNHFKKGVPHLKQVRDVKVSKKDKAGLVQEISIKGARGYATLTGKKVYSLLKDVKSYCFTVQRQQDAIVFKGRGYGHHLGLCQWGAREMVKQGKDYREVLQFYYPDTQFMTLS